MMPLVSVLVPVYGVEKYIACCARSLFGQTYGNIEYIFVDDCTPDGSIEVLRGVMDGFPGRHGNIRILRQDRNRGLGAARLRALEECSGDYVIHVDSDDCMPPDAVELLVAAALASGADIVDGAYREFADDGVGADTANTADAAGIAAGAAVLPRHLPKEKYLKLMLLQNFVKNNIWGRLYRRTLYTGQGIFPVEGIDYGEDFGIVPRLMLTACRSYIDNVVYLYRNDNTGSYTHKRTPRQDRSLINANAAVYKYFLDNDRDAVYLGHLCMGMINLYRYARRQGLSLQDVDRALGRPVTGCAPRLCRVLFGCRYMPYGVADLIYRMLRRMYL